MKISKRAFYTKFGLIILLLAIPISFMVYITKQSGDHSLLNQLFRGKVIFENGMAYVMIGERKQSIEIPEYLILYEGNEVSVICKQEAYQEGEDHLEYEIHNYSEKTIIASPAYMLDASADGKWYHIYHFPMGNVGAVLLRKGESHTFFLDTNQTAGYIDDTPSNRNEWEFVPVPLPKGYYRIIPIVHFSDGGFEPVSTIYPYACFTIK